MSETAKKTVEEPGVIGRRRFLNSAAALGVAGGRVGVVACKDEGASGAGAASGASGTGAGKGAAHKVGGAGSVEVKPGELDTHYGLWSSGHTGDARILGMAPAANCCVFPASCRTR